MGGVVMFGRQGGAVETEKYHTLEPCAVRRKILLRLRALVEKETNA
ncbi:MAG TPA: hypothetical protein VHC20_07240 [Candidatus Paceibacterota bacterium]|nr:hypothetical protein [Candidatus Paceibacterota bacterium]